MDVNAKKNFLTSSTRIIIIAQIIQFTNRKWARKNNLWRYWLEIDKKKRGRDRLNIIEKIIDNVTEIQRQVTERDRGRDRLDIIEISIDRVTEIQSQA